MGAWGERKYLQTAAKTKEWVHNYIIPIRSASQTEAPLYINAWFSPIIHNKSTLVKQIHSSDIQNLSAPFQCQHPALLIGIIQDHISTI